MLLITPDNVKQIFKSDLEADQMLSIFNFFIQQNDDFFKSHANYLLNFIGALQSVKPFELTCEFLMEDEIKVIKDLISKI